MSEDESSAFLTICLVEIDFAFKSLCESFADIEPQSSAFHEVIELGEPVEYLVSLLRRHTLACIGDGECYHSRILITRAMQYDASL